MGDLNIHDLQAYIDKYGCNIFIETGTGIGDGIAHALKYPFDFFYSIEINKELYKRAYEKIYPNNKVVLINKPSIEGLQAVFGNIISEHTCLYWLDAHFPGADFQLASYSDEIAHNLKYPLIHELRLIRNRRKGKKDVYIIDDLQMMEEGEYELKMTDEFLDKHFQREIRLEISQMFKDTHDFRKDNRHQGFLILTPKREEN